MARWFTLVVLSVVLGLVSVARAEVAGPPPTPTEWVTDNVHALHEEARSSVGRRLAQYAETSGHQLLVWIGDTTGDVPLEEFAVRALASWKVGRKGIDDGIVLFLFTHDRKVRIEVGYGLEDKVPDAVAGRIIRETMAPRIRAGDMDGAVSAGVEAIIARIDAKPGPEGSPGDERALPGLSVLQMVLLALGGLVVVAFLLMHPSLAAFFLVSFLSPGRREGPGSSGGFMGGGGGFTGGGGRSGGGGASGSW